MRPRESLALYKSFNTLKLALQRYVWIQDAKFTNKTLCPQQENNLGRGLESHQTGTQLSQVSSTIVQFSSNHTLIFTDI